MKSNEPGISADIIDWQATGRSRALTPNLIPLPPTRSLTLFLPQSPYSGRPQSFSPPPPSALSVPPYSLPSASALHITTNTVSAARTTRVVPCQLAIDLDDTSCVLTASTAGNRCCDSPHSLRDPVQLSVNVPREHNKLAAVPLVPLLLAFLAYLPGAWVTKHVDGNRAKIIRTIRRRVQSSVMIKMVSIRSLKKPICAEPRLKTLPRTMKSKSDRRSVLVYKHNVRCEGHSIDRCRKLRIAKPASKWWRRLGQYPSAYWLITFSAQAG